MAGDGLWLDEVGWPSADVGRSSYERPCPAQHGLSVVSSTNQLLERSQGLDEE